jgi:protein TonB
VEDIMKAPTVIPKTIRQVKDEPEPPPQVAVGVVGGVPGGVPGGTAGGVLGGIIGSNAPPPPPPPKAATPKRIRVGGQVESAKLIFKPQPEYPPLAKMARIQGTVRLEAIISKDGTIQDLKVISGHPLLVKAALEAVQRWRYQPTLLNGDPVEVVTEIDVNYTLAE